MTEAELPGSLVKNQQALGSVRTVVYTIIPALGRRQQEDHEFKAILGYIGDSRPTWATGNLTSNKQTKQKQTNRKDDWRLI